MSLPITREQAHKAVKWMKTNFYSEIAAAVQDTPFSVDHVCGIGCQETAYFWLSFIDTHSVEEVLARCVLDASGDFPGTRRSAFPKNTAVFRAAYGDAFTDMLINEANLTRQMRGFGPKDWVYKGYGIFQYDLQYVTTDQPFFENRKWYNFSDCLANAMKELKKKWLVQNDLWKSIKSYNGSGSGATEYANNVIQYTQYSNEVAV